MKNLKYYAETFDGKKVIVEKLELTEGAINLQGDVEFDFEGVIVVNDNIPVKRIWIDSNSIVKNKKGDE